MAAHPLRFTEAFVENTLQPSVSLCTAQLPSLPHKCCPTTNSPHDRTVNHGTCAAFLNPQTNPIFIDDITEAEDEN